MNGQNTREERILKWVVTEQHCGQGEFTDQVKKALLSAKEEAYAAGMSPDTYVKCNMTFKRPGALEQVLRIYSEVISTNFPAFKATIEDQVINDSEFSVEIIGVKSDEPVIVEKYFFDESKMPCSVKVGNYIFTSAITPETETTLEIEASSALNRMIKAVQMAGGCKEDIVKNIALLLDCTKFNDFNSIYSRVFCDNHNPPARSLHGVSQIEGGFKVAIEGIAYLGNTREVITVGKRNMNLPFCQAMQSGNLLFISGQVGLIDDKGGFNLDFKPQVKRMFQIVNSIAKAGGVDLKDFIKSNVFIRDINNAGVFMDYYEEVYNDKKCPSMIYQVSGLAHEAILIEMDVVAHVGK